MTIATAAKNLFIISTLALLTLATPRAAHAEFQGDVIEVQTITITGSRCSFYSYVLNECPNHPMGFGELFWMWSVRAQSVVQGLTFSGFGNTVQAALTLKNNVDKKFNDSCYNTGEDVGQWLGRTIAQIALQNGNDSALILAAAEMRNINATAFSFGQLVGYTNAVLASVGAKQGTLHPAPC